VETLTQKLKKGKRLKREAGLRCAREHGMCSSGLGGGIGGENEEEMKRQGGENDCKALRAGPKSSKIRARGEKPHRTHGGKY